jgi:chromosomal replication initiation ATPase DnaA
MEIVVYSTINNFKRINQIFPDLRQLIFNFPFIDNQKAEEFIISPENSAAFNFVNSYSKENPNTPNIFSILGEKHSGKTHLAKIWQEKVEGKFLDVEGLENTNLSDLIRENKAYIIEDINEIKNQKTLFHLFNFALERNCHLLITSAIPFTAINYQFADLASRLKNIFTLRIENPGIDLIKTILVKNFSLRQLMVDDQVIDYIAKNIERSYKAIHEITKVLEFQCFEKKRTITVPLVSEVLKNSVEVRA